VSEPEFYPQGGGHPPVQGGPPSQPPHAYQQYAAEPYQAEPYPPHAYRADPYAAEPYPEQPYPKPTYPEQSHAQQPYPEQSYQQQSYAPDSYPQGSYPPDSYPHGSQQPDQYQPDQYPSHQYQPGQYQADQYQSDQYQPDQYQPDQHQPRSDSLELTGSEAAARHASTGAFPSRWLAILGLLILIPGLLLPESGHSSLGRVPLWTLFAVACAVAVVVGVLRVAAGGDRLAVLAAAGLAGYWLLLVLPVVASETGFLQTAACALCGGAAWLGRTGPAAHP
jgi:hypothetical protein